MSHYRFLHSIAFFMTFTAANLCFEKQSSAETAGDPNENTGEPRTAVGLSGGTIGTDAAKTADTPPPEYVMRRQLPDNVTLAELSNGLTVIVQENHVAPVATVRCYVKNTGSAFEGENLGVGLSHVLEHVVAGGSTSKRTEKEIENIIDRFGGATNAFTSSGLTAYFIDCPSKDTMTAIDLIADSMQHIIFDPSEFERELKVVQRELADGEVNRQRVRWKMLSQSVYQVHPMRHPTIGYLDVLQQTTNQTIIDFYKERYVPNNQVFVVVGDVDTEEVLQAIANNYAGTPRGKETFVPMPDEPEQLSPRSSVREMDGATYDLTFAWPTVKLADRDLYALDVAAYILAEGESSRLARKLKYQEQIALSVGSASYTPHFVNGMFAITASTTPDTWEQASKEILEEVYRLKDELVSSDELAKAKKQKASELVRGQQTVQQAADALGRNFISSGDPLFDKAYVEGISQVTAEQIRDVARKYFLPERLNTVIIAPPGGAPENVEGGKRGESGEIRAVKLKNGLRVLLKRHSHQPLVNIQAFVLGGNLADTPQTAGRSALVAAMLNKGTANHTAEEIANYFDSIGGRLGTSAGRFTVYGSATTLTEDFPDAAALFAECFTASTFPKEEYAKVQKIALGGIAARAGNPQAEVMELFMDQLPDGSPFHVISGGKKKTVEALTADDLKAYHHDFFVPQNMIVTVFGDIDTDEALKLVDKHFGHLQPSESFEPLKFDRPNALKETIVEHKTISKETGMVMLGYPAMSILEKKEYAAMTLLDAITSGYSYPGGWLHTELRGEGLVYYVHAFPVAGPSPGYFAVLSQTRPDAIEEVVGRIQKNLQQAKEGEISDEEFERAKEMVKSLHAQQNTTIAAQAQQAALDELYGLGYGYESTFDERIDGVEKVDVIAVAKKYLSGNHVLVTTSPESR